MWRVVRFFDALHTHQSILSNYLNWNSISPSLSLYTNMSKRDIESPGSAHVSTTYVRIYRIGALCYRKHASTYIRMALETIDTIVTCAISETAILDTPSKAPPLPPSVRGCYTIDTNCRLWKCRDTLCKVQRFTAGTSTCHQVSNLSLSLHPQRSQPLFARNPLL